MGRRFLTVQIIGGQFFLQEHPFFHEGIETLPHRLKTTFVTRLRQSIGINDVQEGIGIVFELVFKFVGLIADVRACCNQIRLVPRGTGGFEGM